MLSTSVFSTYLLAAVLAINAVHAQDYKVFLGGKKLRTLLELRELGRDEYPGCQEGKSDCGSLGHPEICCPSPPESFCVATNNTLTGVFCCRSPDPEKQPCDDRNLACDKGWYECPAKFNGGCCEFGQFCGAKECYNSDDGPKNQEEVDQLYGLKPKENDKTGDTNDDIVNDGDRFGDDEPKDLDGLRTTKSEHTKIWTATMTESKTTYTTTLTSGGKEHTEYESTTVSQLENATSTSIIPDPNKPQPTASGEAAEGWAYSSTLKGIRVIVAYCWVFIVGVAYWLV